GADARRRGDLRSPCASPAARQAGPQAEEGTATAQPAGCGPVGRPQSPGPGALGLARYRGDRLWSDSAAARPGVPGGVAGGVGIAPDPDRGGARPGGGGPGCVLVYEGSGGQPVGGSDGIRPPGGDWS